MRERQIFKAIFCFLAIVDVARSSLVPASAASPREWADCSLTADFLRAKSACSSIISRRSETPHDRAAAYNNRGLSWYTEGDHDQAIADLDSAIQIDPNLALAYDNRGAAWFAKGDDDRAIADYNAAIRIEPNDAEPYYNRGNLWRARSDNDRAIADYSMAIMIDPKFAFAYHNRSRAWQAKGDEDRAIADYDAALRIDPNFANCYRGRGKAYFFKADFTSAAADFLKASDLADDPYAMLWHFLARGRMGEDGTSELSANAARLKTKEWPYPVIDFYLQRRSLDALHSAAANADQTCEAAFYIGEWLLLHGKTIVAKAPMQEATDRCPKSSEDYTDAVEELKRLNP